MGIVYLACRFVVVVVVVFLELLCCHFNTVITFCDKKIFNKSKHFSPDRRGVKIRILTNLRLSQVISEVQLESDLNRSVDRGDWVHDIKGREIRTVYSRYP